MKIRLGFVSNSSSASFIVVLSKLTEDQQKIILNYQNHSDMSYDFDNKDFKYHDGWNIRKNEEIGTIQGFTVMDNGDLDKYLKENGINTDLFEWGDF